jgi:hypothetical protein
MTPNEMNQKALRECIEVFLMEFVEKPYLCYTEHGQHALFFDRLHQRLATSYEACTLGNQTIETCLIQKEYPTADHLDKPRRQNWDISLLETPLVSIKSDHPFDYFKLAAVVEFGMNEQIAHLIDDYLRVSHQEANVDHRYVVQLYRLSTAGKQISGRDWSPNARDITRWLATELLDLIENLKKLSVGNDKNPSDQSIKELIYKLLEEPNSFNNEEKKSIRQMLENPERPRNIFNPVTFYIAMVDTTNTPKPSSVMYRIENGISTVI